LEYVIFYAYKSIAYASKVVGHIIFIKSYLGHAVKMLRNTTMEQWFPNWR